MYAMTLLAFNISDSIVPQKENYCVHQVDNFFFSISKSRQTFESLYGGRCGMMMSIKDCTLFCHTLYNKAELRLS